MVTLLSKFFIKDREKYSDPKVRRAYGTLCSIVGILLNILMFIGKYIAGVVSKSISITADAFNNLSDAGSSIITLFGFRLSGKAPDPDHPFGHGRIEYLSGLGVSIAIVVMGFELMKSSVTKIIHPEPIEASLLAGGIMIASILIKVYMAVYNRGIGKKIDSAAMKSVAADSLSDTVSTVVVLLSMIVSHFTSVNIDAYAGVLVAALILYTGFTSARDTVSPLLGNAPSHEFIQKIQEIVLRQEHVVGIHDLIVHDYGPGRVFISLHAEVPGNEDIFVIHDEIDNAEIELQKTLGCHAVIHMDPVCVDDGFILETKEKVNGIVKGIDPVFSIHDFRMVPGDTHTNLIFDLVVPAKYKLSNEEVGKIAKERIEAQEKGCFAVITVEQSYI